jgi:hypothetical protein
MNGILRRDVVCVPCDMAAPRCVGLMRPWRRYSRGAVVRPRSYIDALSRLHSVGNHMFEHIFEPSPSAGVDCYHRKIVNLRESLTLGRAFRQASPCAQLAELSCRERKFIGKIDGYMPGPVRGLGSAPPTSADCTLLNLNPAHLGFAPSAAELSQPNSCTTIF